MNSLNSVLIEGNLTKDPVLKTLPSGTVVCEFTLGSNRFYKQENELQKESSFFDVECWSRLAQACADNLVKGRGVRIVGRLKQDRWMGPDGTMRTRVKVVAEHVEFKPVVKKQLDTNPAEALAEEETQINVDALVD